MKTERSRVFRLLSLFAVAVLVFGLCACDMRFDGGNVTTQTTTDDPGAATPTVPPEVVNDIATLDPLKNYKAKAEEILNIAGLPEYSDVQAGCFDGQYYYIALESSSDSVNGCRLIKLDKEGVAVAQSTTLDIDNIGNMTYNAKRAALVISHRTAESVKCSFIDSGTLAENESVTLDAQPLAIGYCEKLDKYASASLSGYEISIWDDQLDPVKQQGAYPDRLSTAEGVFCDERYIYFLRSGNSRVIIYDWELNHIKTVLIELYGGNTPESISVVDGTTYIFTQNSAKTGGKIYKLSFEVTDSVSSYH